MKKSSFIFVLQKTQQQKTVTSRRSPGLCLQERLRHKRPRSDSTRRLVLRGQRINSVDFHRLSGQPTACCMHLNNAHNPAWHAAHRANTEEAVRCAEQMWHSKQVAEAKWSQEGDAGGKAAKSPFNSGVHGGGWAGAQRTEEGHAAVGSFRKIKQQIVESNYYIGRSLKDEDYVIEKQFYHRYNWGIPEQQATKEEKFSEY